MKAIIWVVAMAGRAALNGFVVSVLWSWFIAPTFGVRRLSVAEALGLSLFIGYFLLHLKREEYFDKSKPESERMAAGTVMQVMTAGLVLGLAWIVRQFL